MWPTLTAAELKDIKAFWSNLYFDVILTSVMMTTNLFYANSDGYNSFVNIKVINERRIYYWYNAEPFE